MEEYFGADIAFDFDFITQPTGDVEMVAGRKCLLQDLQHRLMTAKGDLWSHPDYGTEIYEFLHDEATEINQLDLEQAIATAVEQDPRIVSGSAQAEVLVWERDKIRVRVACQPIDGGNPLNLVLQYGITEITAEVVSGNGF